MLNLLLATALVPAGCATAPAAAPGPAIEQVPGQPRVVRILLDKAEAFRLSRAGVMDPSSASGLTDRVRYREAVEGYVAQVLARHGLCAGGFGNLEVAPAPSPFDTSITVVCLAP